MPYIVLFRGDDTDFTWNKEVKLRLNTEADMTGFTATFRLLTYVKEFSEIPEDKTLVLNFSSADTAGLPTGLIDASLTLKDTNGKVRTVCNKVRVLVTTSVCEAYATGDDGVFPIEIVDGPTRWDNVEKPFDPAMDEFDMEADDWSFRKVVAKMFQALNGKVVNND